MRLLLDGHYAKTIAEQLRKLGHDVVAAGERPDLIGLPDAELFSAAAAERRVIVTESWAHFAVLVAHAAHEAVDRYGVVFTSVRRMPRAKSTIGQFVEVLGQLLGEHAAEGALHNSVRWLP